MAARTRRQQFSHSLKVQAASASTMDAEDLLHSSGPNVELARSRPAATLFAVKRSLGDIKKYWATRHERRRASDQAQPSQDAVPPTEDLRISDMKTDVAGQAGIAIPNNNWREKAMQQVKARAASFGGILQKVKAKVAPRIKPQVEVSNVGVEAVPARQLEEAVRIQHNPAPQIRIIRVDAHETKPKPNQPETQDASPGQTPKGRTPQGRFIARLKKAEPPKPSIFEQVNDAITSGQLEQAEEMLIPYIVKHTKDKEAYMLLGQVAIAKGAWEEAMEVFQQVVRLDPNLTDAQAGLGYAALQQGKFSIALQALQQAHKADPENVQIVEQLLNIARRLDNKVLQKSMLQELVELQPDNKKASESLRQLVS
ncbi:MAG: tetratricopeptide repeat protein [Candidatus Sungbacteria bacterium]|nr:tetratricopeptide repeat protein [Candidatus Sungbacteria bacterium]